MYSDTFILTILVKNAKLNIKKKKKKKQPKFSKILGRSEKGKQTSFFIGLTVKLLFASKLWQINDTLKKYFYNPWPTLNFLACYANMRFFFFFMPQL